MSATVSLSQYRSVLRSRIRHLRYCRKHDMVRPHMVDDIRNMWEARN